MRYVTDDGQSFLSYETARMHEVQLAIHAKVRNKICEILALHPEEVSAVSRVPCAEMHETVARILARPLTEYYQENFQ